VSDLPGVGFQRQEGHPGAAVDVGGAVGRNVVTVLRVERTRYATSGVSNKVPASKYVGSTDTPGRRRCGGGSRSLRTLHNCRRSGPSVATTDRAWTQTHYMPVQGFLKPS